MGSYVADNTITRSNISGKSREGIMKRLFVVLASLLLMAISASAGTVALEQGKKSFGSPLSPAAGQQNKATALRPANLYCTIEAYAETYPKIRLTVAEGQKVAKRSCAMRRIKTFPRIVDVPATPDNKGQGECVKWGEKFNVGWKVTIGNSGGWNAAGGIDGTVKAEEVSYVNGSYTPSGRAVDALASWPVILTKSHDKDTSFVGMRGPDEGKILLNVRVIHETGGEKTESSCERRITVVPAGSIDGECMDCIN